MHFFREYNICQLVFYWLVFTALTISVPVKSSSSNSGHKNFQPSSFSQKQMWKVTVSSGDFSMPDGAWRAAAACHFCCLCALLCRREAGEDSCWDSDVIECGSCRWSWTKSAKKTLLNARKLCIVYWLRLIYMHASECRLKVMSVNKLPCRFLLLVLGEHSTGYTYSKSGRSHFDRERKSLRYEG